jgi:hypothetical protein
LYGCETWSLTFREEDRLKVLDNRALRRIFEPKRDGVTGEGIKLHNEELNDLYKQCKQCFGGESEGKRPLGRTGRRGRIILRRIFRKWDVGPWTILIWLKKGTGGRHL